jgi:hypothetical protein
MNGLYIEAVDEVNALILESVTAWKNYKKMPSRSSEGVTRRSTNAQDRSNVYSLNSRDLGCHTVSMI